MPQPAEPGTPSWFELHTRDYRAAVLFSVDVLGWDAHVASDTDTFRYTTLGMTHRLAASPGWPIRPARRSRRLARPARIRPSLSRISPVIQACPTPGAAG